MNPVPVKPRYGEASLADVLPGVLAALGVPGTGDPLGLSRGPLVGVRRVAVLLIDGLGQYQLPLAAPHAPTLAALAASPAARVLTTGFPSTTPTSLASFGTGAAPGAHGLVGFKLNVPGTDQIVNHIEWWNEPDPLRWQPLRTQFERAEAAGVRAIVVSRPEFRDGGLSRAANRGAAYRGASNVDALAAGILAALRAGPGPVLVHGYHPDVDRMGHRYGVDSPEWQASVSEVDRLLSTLIAGLPADGALLVTADHGQLNVPAEGRFDLDTDPRLRAGIRVVAGEARVRYLHTLPGATDDVLATWRGVLGPAARVITREEAVAEGWFGPIPEEHLQRVGDVVAICEGDSVVLATRTEKPTVAAMVAFHGAATAVEMMIPLLSYSPSGEREGGGALSQG